MAREIKPDGDIKFGGFASYPNSSSFNPEEGMLEYAENVINNEGVIEKRNPLYHVSATYGIGDGPVTYACAAHGPSGDSILLWGANLRVNCDTGNVTTVNLAAKQKARGQGYADAITMETLDPDWVAGAYITERLVTAKDDRCRFTLYTGNLPYEPDDARLVQNTYDPIQAIVPRMNSFFAFGKRSIYFVQAGLGRQANIDREPNEQVFHKIQKVSSNDGLAAKDGWAETNGLLFFVDQDGIKVIQGDKYSDGMKPISLMIKDIWDQIDSTKYSEITAVGLKGRVYFTLPLLGSYNKKCVLVLNTEIKPFFESLHVYPFDVDYVMTARRNGVMRVFGVCKANGNVFLLDGTSQGASEYGTPYVAKIRSRNYMLQSHHDKKYDDCYLYLNTNGSASVDLNFISVNPDGKWTLDTFSNKNLGTAIRRALANKKSMGGKLEIVINSGFPSIYGIGVDASLVGRTIFSSF